MRRQYFWWTFLVIAILLTTYGGYLLIYHFNHGSGLSIPSLLMLIFGSLMLILFGVLSLMSHFGKKKQDEIEPVVEEEKEETEEIKSE